MEEKTPSTSSDKPFSVLEKFRQLKKEKEHTLIPPEIPETPTTSETVFQVSKSTPHNSSNEHYGKTDGSNTGRGKFHAKRSLNDSSDDRPNKRLPVMHLGQKEIDVGITEYVRDNPGFDVIIKHRYSDFHVNEIDLDGNIIKLTSTDIPVKDTESETVTKEEDPSVMSPEQWAELKVITEKELSTTVNIDVTDFNKDQRQRIHKAVKRRFGAHVFSNTKEENGRKIMQIGYAAKHLNRRFNNWPRGRPEYLHFVLYKERENMTEVVNVLSRFTLIKANRFGYAGTKDKRAVTTQQMCVRRRDCERFRTCSKLRGIALGNYVYKWENLRLGDLSGNRFKIALRNVKVSDDVIHESVEELKKSGFINYFGLQRFGQSVTVPTYAIGKAILKGDWKSAVELILKPRPGEHCYKDLLEAKEIWWNTKDASKALKALTRKDKSIEGKILIGLRKHGPNAYQNAFDNLPHQTVTLYLHAYQSLIWNQVVSRRIRQFGLKVLPGDLVRAGPETDNQNLKADTFDDGSDEEKEVIDDIESGCSAKIQMRTVTAEEAETVSIYDVFYPLPGDDIRLPDNEVALWYEEFLQKDSYSMNSFHTCNKKYGMYGSYRNMMGKAEDLNWHSVRYSDPDEDLIMSDLDVLRGKPPLKHDPDGPYKAVIIEFNLKVCSYATMALRELTKCETSPSNQTMLTRLAWEEDQALKQQRLRADEEKAQSMETEPVVSNPNNCNVEEHGKTCNMDTEEASTHAESQGENLANDADEIREMNKREAVADNIINKYLESNYR